MICFTTLKISVQDYHCENYIHRLIVVPHRRYGPLKHCLNTLHLGFDQYSEIMPFLL